MCLGCTAAMKQALDCSLGSGCVGNGSSGIVVSVGFCCMRRLSRCPCCVACGLGECLVSMLTPSPRKSGKIPCCSACCSVNKVGKNRLACVKATICAIVVPVAVAASATAGKERGIVDRPDVV